MSKLHELMAIIAGLPGVSGSTPNTDYTQKMDIQREKQAAALAKKQAVRNQIRARRAAKETT